MRGAEGDRGSYRRRYLPPLAWMGLIFAFSHQPLLPEVGGPWLDLLFKKGLHALAYAILARLWLRALDPDGDGAPAARRTAFLICLAWALSDEWHQTFVPGRTGRLRDVGIDAVGSLLALAWRRRGLGSTPFRAPRRHPPLG